MTFVQIPLIPKFKFLLCVWMTADYRAPLWAVFNSRGEGWAQFRLPPFKCITNGWNYIHKEMGRGHLETYPTLLIKETLKWIFFVTGSCHDISIWFLASVFCICIKQTECQYSVILMAHDCLECTLYSFWSYQI